MNLRTLTFALAILTTAQTSIAQFRGGGRYYASHYAHYDEYDPIKRKGLKRQYLAFSYPMSTIQLDYIYKEHPQNGQKFDTSIHLSKKSSVAYGFSGGSFAKIAKLGNAKQMLAFDWSIGGAYYTYNLVDYQDAAGDDLSLTALTMLFEAPLGLQYKTGGEASLNPKDKLLFSMGAGVAPTVAITGFAFSNDAGGDVGADIVFKLRSYVMAEVGMYFGVAMKVRAMYYVKPFTLYKREEGDLETGQISATLTSNSNIVVSLIILPFSPKWKDYYDYYR
jgi:hypothetical protein